MGRPRAPQSAKAGKINGSPQNVGALNQNFRCRDDLATAETKFDTYDIMAYHGILGFSNVDFFKKMFVYSGRFMQIPYSRAGWRSTEQVDIAG